MSTDKLKRVNLSDEVYAAATQIGKNTTSDKKAADVGVEIAINHYQTTKEIDPIAYQLLLKFKGVDASILNNIEAIQVLAKNADLTDDEVSAKINTALKSIITDIMGL